MLLNIGHICSENFPPEIMILWSVLSENVCHVLRIYTRRYPKNLEVLESTGSSSAICRNVKQFDIGTENYVVQDDKLEKKTSSETAARPTCPTALPRNLRAPFISTHTVQPSRICSFICGEQLSCTSSHICPG